MFEFDEKKIVTILRYVLACIFILLAVFITPKLVTSMMTREFTSGDGILINILRALSFIFAIIILLSKFLIDKYFGFFKKYPIEKKIFLILLSIIACIGILHMLTYFIHSKIFDYNFNLDNEWNFTTWFSAGLLLAVGLLSITNAILSKDTLKKYFWSLFGIIFMYLSLDDTVQIHEQFSRWFHVSAWFLIGAPVAILVFAIVLYIAIKAKIDKNTWKLIFLGIGILLIGQVGVESIGTYFLTFNSLPYHIEVLIEETLGKTVAISIIAYALIKNIRVESAIKR